MPVTTRSKRLVRTPIHSDPKPTEKSTMFKVMRKKRSPAKSTLVSSRSVTSMTVNPIIEVNETSQLTKKRFGHYALRPKDATNITTKKRANKLRDVPMKKKENQTTINVSNPILDWRLPSVGLNAKILAQRFDDYFSASDEEGERETMSNFKKTSSQDKLVMGIHTKTSSIVFDDNIPEAGSHVVTHIIEDNNNSSTYDDIHFESHFVHKEKNTCTRLTAAQIAANWAKYDDVE